MEENIINVRIIEDATSILDFLPYIISILSILVSVVIVFIQYRQNIKLHEKATIYNAKK